MEVIITFDRLPRRSSVDIKTVCHKVECGILCVIFCLGNLYGDLHGQDKGYVLNK